MKQPLISVIIPVYLVSDYLDKCLKSIAGQRYSNLEIILVENGSPDNCALKCDEWAEKDSRIIVIHKQHGCLAGARNHGMRIICGDYVSYIDSDDYISDDFYEVLVTTALEHCSDVVECGFARFYENGECEEYQDDCSVSDYSASEGLSALIDENPFYQHVWDKLYKREVVQNISFEVGKQHEDVFWTYQVFGRAERITRINRTMYFYLQRKTSIIGQGYSLKSLDSLEGRWNRVQYIKRSYPELYSKAKLDFFGSCMYMMQCVLKYMSGDEKRQAVAIIRKYKRKCRVSFKELSAVQGGAKKYAYLAKINIYLCGKLRAVLNIGF